MSAVPLNPKIFHITHVDNLAQVIRKGGLWSDAKRIEMNLDCMVVGMPHIKQRRLERLQVKCHPGTFVGEYVPLYFCPRSIMLFILHRGNLPEVTYHGGQGPIVHLQADLDATIRWADEHEIQWAFSNMNAGSFMADFYNRREDLSEISWDAVQSNDFRDVQMRNGKQAEFLVHGIFPWHLVEKIGVCCQETLAQVQNCLSGKGHKPLASVEKEWYF
jgi:hypothetical protein